MKNIFNNIYTPHFFQHHSELIFKQLFSPSGIALFIILQDKPNKIPVQ